MGGASCCSGASGITGRIGAVEPAHAVEAEAVSAAVGPVEDGRWRLASHGLAGALEPAAVLGALPFKGPPWEGRHSGLWPCECFRISDGGEKLPPYLLGLLVTW